MPKNRISIIGSKKGLSLPLVTGLVTLLMVASVAANELIIRTIRSVRGVESSNRAYFAAEAGIEDGLYELSPHQAGYQTPVIGTDNARRDIFDAKTKGDLNKCGDIENGNRWATCWDIESRSGAKTWQGKILKDQKLIISLFADENHSNGSLGANIISTAIDVAQIKNLNPPPSDISIKLSVPSIAGGGMLNLTIDNDQDGQLNEDPPNWGSATCPDGSKNPNPEDKDCDGRVDEDSDMDPVILWKLSDSNGRSLIPLAGCLGDANSKTSGNEKSEMCERDFKNNGGFFSATLDSDSYGLNELGAKQTIRNFIDAATDAPMQLEFLIVAPMEYINQLNQKIAIPYIQYEVKSNITSQIPYPYFTINSDGYYGTYKQSITTTLTPKTTVPLFDFTIIQQQ
jgi:hypothetical protein